MNQEDVLGQLLEGNREYAEGRTGQLERHVSGQRPKAVILTCSDSRVVPEFIFGQDIGDIFTVLVAGNIATGSTVIQSIEYAVDHLNVPLLIVLGHTNCGAVGLAVEKPVGSPLVEEISAGFALDPDPVRANVKRQVKEIPGRSQVIGNAASSGKLKIIGAVYDLGSGLVSIIE